MRALFARCGKRNTWIVRHLATKPRYHTHHAWCFFFLLFVFLGGTLSMPSTFYFQPWSVPWQCSVFWWRPHKLRCKRRQTLAILIILIGVWACRLVCKKHIWFGEFSPTMAWEWLNISEAMAVYELANIGHGWREMTKTVRKMSEKLPNRAPSALTRECPMRTVTVD